jgi:hypothetical protein
LHRSHHPANSSFLPRRTKPYQDLAFRFRHFTHIRVCFIASLQMRRAGVEPARRTTLFAATRRRRMFKAPRGRDGPQAYDPGKRPQLPHAARGTIRLSKCGPFTRSGGSWSRPVRWEPLRKRGSRPRGWYCTSDDTSTPAPVMPMLLSLLAYRPWLRHAARGTIRLSKGSPGARIQLALFNIAARVLHHGSTLRILPRAQGPVAGFPPTVTFSTRQQSLD